MKRIGIIIFARLNSKRLPNKILKNIDNTTILEIILKRVKLVKNIKNVILALPKTDKNKKISEIIENYNVSTYYGSSLNVLKRAQLCCKNNNLNYFIRVNADRPFLDFELINKVLKNKDYFGYDLVTNNLFGKAPTGLTFEMIKAKNFLKIKDKNKGEKEHICNHFYNNKDKFKILGLNIKKYEKFKSFNFALDNRKDLIKVMRIYKKLRYNFRSKISQIFHVSKGIRL